MAKTSEEVAAAKAEAAEASKRLKEMQVRAGVILQYWHPLDAVCTGTPSFAGTKGKSPSRTASPVVIVQRFSMVTVVLLCCRAGPPLRVRRGDPVAGGHPGEAGQEGGGLRVGDEEAGRQVSTVLTLLCYGRCVHG